MGGDETETEDSGRLTAQKYLEAYYDIDREDPQMRDHLRQVLDACKGFELIDIGALQEAFPFPARGGGLVVAGGGVGVAGVAHAGWPSACLVMLSPREQDV